jgi:hypothetical protein
MKLILLFTCAITLIMTTGCFFPGRGGDRGWHGHDRGEVILAPSAVAMQAPEVIVTPPLVKVSAPEVVVR